MTSLRTKAAYTMVELLMVMMLMAILGNLAITAFLDFRKDAQASVLRQNLTAIRVGIKNQTQQAILRCGISNISTWLSAGNANFYTALLVNLDSNDITAQQASSTFRICTQAQVPAPGDRIFIDLPTASYARFMFGGVDATPLPWPSNPFVTPGGPSGGELYVKLSPNNVSVVSAGGQCAYVNANQSAYHYHWVYIQDTGVVFPGTNTSGISECAW